jgi:quercetin dioxygenase-like cupin family protein
MSDEQYAAPHEQEHTTPPITPAPIRRVVTGTTPDGRSCVACDGPVPANAAWSEPGVRFGADPRIVRRVPVDLSEPGDSLAGYALQEWPSPGGAIVRVITWQPGFAFPMHRSATLDIFFILAGQVELVLGEGSVVVKAGDVVVQRGTLHGWRVVGDEPCTVAGVRLDATPAAR